VGPEKVTDRLLVWGADQMESGTLEQAARASRLPFVAGHVALMPDAHVGKGATVGSVLPTVGAVIPAAVGVDIGCGMVAVEMSATASQLPDDLGAVLQAIEAVVPAGVGRGHDHVGSTARAWLAGRPNTLTARQEATALAQFGTLGSGNHFLEVCLDERDRVWLVLHSGSRGIGNQLASAHIERAQKLASRWFLDLEDPDLAYLPEGTPEFDAYIEAMLWSQDYAYANRQYMATEAIRVLAAVMPFQVIRSVNCHHNFTQREHHHHRDIWVTRKGAIRARTGDEGVIPGSMGTSSYIVRGLGSSASFCSCSHGAGRRMSRGVARRTFTADDLADRMGDRVWNANQAERLIDEIPDSYKDIDAVMAAQADLVTIEHTLRQVLNYKGA